MVIVHDTDNVNIFAKPILMHIEVPIRLRTPQGVVWNLARFTRGYLYVTTSTMRSYLEEANDRSERVLWPPLVLALPQANRAPRLADRR